MAKNELTFLRFPQVVERTNVSKSTINRREAKGRFPKRTRWGGIVVWSSIEIEEFLKDPVNYKVRKSKK